MDSGSVLIRVHRSWDGWRSAEVHMTDLQEVHWRQPNGAPHEFLHAFISCTKLVSGDMSHICDGSAPHRLLVCLLKKHLVPAAYAELARQAEAARLTARNAASSCPAASHAVDNRQTILVG